MKTLLRKIVLLDRKRIGYVALIGFTVVFAVGFVLGMVTALSSTHLVKHFRDIPNFASPLSALSIITKNNVLLACSLFFLGFVTLGLYNIFAIAYNGIIMGTAIGSFVAKGQTTEILTLLLPHGIPEIGWMLGISVFATQLGVSFYRFLDSGLENKDFLVLLLSKTTLLLLSWVIVAALIEVFVTPYIYQYAIH